MVDLVGHFLIFTVIGIGFLLGPLILGLFVRPANPTKEKLSAYECGEPTIGSSYIQFDLRFYVVALLFIIFDVEVAFFFPWATIYGGATQLAVADGPQGLTDDQRHMLSARLLGQAQETVTQAQIVSVETAQKLMEMGLIDLLVFFGVLLVGFAYVWKRGDLDWVRAMSDTKVKRSALQGATLNPDHAGELVGSAH